MALFFLAYLGGALTLLAPCILPVVPFVFARVDRPFARNGLPLLAGMATTFAAVATLGAVAGNWAVTAHTYGRFIAMGLLALMGLTLLMPRVAAWIARPLAALGGRWAAASEQERERSGRTIGPSFLLGAATGLLWAPCAGPVLGLILTGAMIEGPGVRTSMLLLAYAAGAATSLALALLAGRRVVAALRGSLRGGEWLRKGMGAAVLAGVTAIALGLDTGVLAQIAPPAGSALEKNLLERLVPPARATGLPTLPVAAPLPALVLPSEGPMPPISGAVEWLNSPPLTAQQLRGKVVLVDFWTYSCYNCLNALPYVREWHRKYSDQGLVVIGVHAPEFAYEKNIGNVKQAVARLGIAFPVAIDNNFAVWRAFSNQYWPAHYFVDAKGQIRFHHFGEGEYEKSERVIQQLLQEARRDARPA